MILLPASFLASSSVGNSTSQVAKFLWEKYLPGMPAVFKISSKISFVYPASFLVRKSVTTKDRVLGSTTSTNSGIGSISLCLEYFAYFSTLSLS